MNLNSLWFILVAVLYAGFFLLEGFDFGVGMLMPILGKNDRQRRAILSTIGPHWDANEVWLITAGGATFAAFPRWYAAMFSGFYPLLLLLLLALIARGAAIEFRSRLPGAAWRGVWDGAIAIGSLLAAGTLGAVFGNLLRGTPIDASGMYAGNWLAPFNLYSLICGAAAVCLFLLHGGNFLGLKLDGELGQRARAGARRLWFAALILVLGFLSFTFLQTDVVRRLGSGSIILPLVLILGMLLIGYFLRRKRDGWAFFFGGATVVFFAAAFFIALYPRVMVSSLQPSFSLTIYTAASSDYTLNVMTIVALIFVPVVVLYQAWSYWVFRKRIGTDREEEGY
jgi:cytochrome d ubiquinol oxidase subunit II